MEARRGGPAGAAGWRVWRSHGAGAGAEQAEDQRTAGQRWRRGGGEGVAGCVGGVRRELPRPDRGRWRLLCRTGVAETTGGGVSALRNSACLLGRVPSDRSRGTGNHRHGVRIARHSRQPGGLFPQQELPHRSRADITAPLSRRSSIRSKLITGARLLDGRGRRDSGRMVRRLLRLAVFGPSLGIIDQAHRRLGRFLGS